MNAFRRTPTLSAVPLAIAALALSACGSSDDTTSSSTVATGGETVATASIDGAGTVLVDADGNALYSPDQEANGKIQCTGSCEQIWVPLTASGAPSASSDVTGELGTVKRPDGTEQVTLDSAPLYTFAEDSPGQATGDGVQDSFGGKDFTWHAITVGAAAAPDQSTTSSSSGGGGYDY
jgi:predicted lipoprotein with Yx(FWY)xxD motif